MDGFQLDAGYLIRLSGCRRGRYLQPFVRVRDGLQEGVDVFCSPARLIKTKGLEDASAASGGLNGHGNVDVAGFEPDPAGDVFFRCGERSNPAAYAFNAFHAAQDSAQDCSSGPVALVFYDKAVVP